MSQGGVYPVHSNGSHDAMDPVATADAYVFTPGSHAACRCQLSDFDAQFTKHWRHSVLEEHNYTSPFAAVLSAWKLRWETICHDLSCGFERSQYNCFDLRNEDFQNQRDSLTQANGLLLQKHAQKTCTELSSCLRKTEDKQKKRNRGSIHFDDEISIFIGLEDTLAMAVSKIRHDVLKSWLEKPWTKRPPNKKRRLREKAMRDRHPNFAILEDDPLSPQAVLISEKQSRLTDPHFSTNLASSDHDQAQTNHPEGFHVRHEPPQFVQDIFGLPGIQVLPPNFVHESGIMVRTWYIHHSHCPRWKVPRIVELDHNWHLWQQEIVRSWRDQVRFQEPIDLVVVQPDPERHYLANQIHADVIVLQGHRHDMFAGLLTIHESFENRLSRSLALAISLPSVVSRHEIEHASDLVDHCQRSVCRFFFRWDVIDETARHRMRNGDGFSVHILPRSDSSISRAIAQEDATHLMQWMKIKASRIKTCNEVEAPHWYRDHTAQGGHANLQNQMLQDHQAPDHQAEDLGEESGSNDDPDIQPPPDDNESRQAVIMFHLAEAPVHAMLDWTDWPRMIREVAYHFSVDRENVLECHEMTVKPPDIPAGAVPLIVQQVADIPVGTAFVLILVDIEVHVQWMEAHFSIAPFVERKVIAVPALLARSALLSQAEVFEYCRFENQRCLVEYNFHIWQGQESDPKHARFGDFAKIIIPPSLRCDATTGELLADSRQLTPEEFWERYYEPSEPPEPSEVAETSSASSNVSPSLLDSEDIRAEYGRNADELTDDMSVMQRDIIRQPEERNAEPSEQPSGSAQPAPAAFQNETCVTSFSFDRPGRTPLWLRFLNHHFQHEHVIEDQTEGPIVYVTTWYVACTEEKTTEHSRIARLGWQPQFWIRDVLQIWHDHIVQAAPVHFAWVYPTPMALPYSHTIGHLIVFQYPSAAFVPLVVSYSFNPLGPHGIGNAAMVVRHDASPEHVVTVMKLDRVCRGRRCSLHRGTIGGTWTTPLNTGEGLILDIPSPGERYHLKVHSHPRSVATIFEDDVVPNDDGFSMLIEDYSPFIQSLWNTWQQRARQVPNSLERILEVTTWYLDGSQLIYNEEHRTVVLADDFSTWEGEIQRAWSDVADASAPMDLAFVKPVPPPSPLDRIHILAMQSMSFDSRGIVVSRYDNALQQGRPSAAALVVPTPCDKQTVLQLAKIVGKDFPSSSEDHCSLWKEGLEITDEMSFDMQHGLGFNAIIYRHHLPSWEETDSDDSQALLQHSMARRNPPNFDEGDTTFSARVTLCLEDLLQSSDAASADTPWIPVKLKHLDQNLSLPSELFLPDDFQISDIEEDLLRMGYKRHAYALKNLSVVLTVPFNWRADDNLMHFVYSPSKETDLQEPICHSAKMKMTEHDHMKLLYQFGFLRTVILEQHEIRRNLYVIYFRNNLPQLECRPQQERAHGSWPAPQPKTVRTHMIDFSRCQTRKPLHKLNLGINSKDLQSFFESAGGVLCPWYSHLDLQSFVTEGIAATVNQEGTHVDYDLFDRLIIYTDGSSKANERRKPPLRVEEEGTPDAWAYAVIGERYASDTEPGTLTFLGWQAQRVRYNEDSQAFVGTEQIGAEFAEREAMIHAGLWRLAINSNIPTVFRTDSTTTADQSTGRAGFVSAHQTLTILRGIFQTLHTSLGAAGLIVEHVKGHAGDIWNELVDHLAKTEAASGHNLRRQQFDMKIIGPVLPYLWIIFGQRFGLPEWTEHGLDVTPPQLPILGNQVSDVGALKCGRGKYMLSLASFNVGSLFLGPDGFGGKLQYLRQQMHEHALNLIGVQEARSPPGLSMADDVLRIAGGSDKGRFGIELWIALRQPFAIVKGRPLYFQRSHVQLLHHDPRRLIVCIVHPALQFFAIVLHAPQSGRPVQERKAWWQETTALISEQCKTYPIFVMMDANAKTGPPRPPIVFQHGDTSSSSTAFLNDFLLDTELCLPCTSEVHAGEHCTWTSPDGNSHHRIDFIAIPQSLLGRCFHSQVLNTIDNGNLNADHHATAVQLVWHEECAGLPRVSSSHTHDRHLIAKNKGHLSFENLTGASWTDDIETQVQSLNHSLHQTLTKSCPREKRAPKKSYIDQGTWDLRNAKLHMRRRLQTARRQMSFDLIARYFKLWAADPGPDVHERNQQFQTSALCYFFTLSCRYWSCTQQLKKRLQTDRARGLQEVLNSKCKDAAASTLLHVLRPFIGPTNPKKQKRASLPIVKQADGAICRSPEEAQTRWLQFFSEMEGGQLLSMYQYRQHWIEGLSHFRAVDALDIPIQSLPTLTELEMAFRRVTPGKAVGLDQIPPELCHHCPVPLAQACYSIMLKVALYGQEAVEHKGGQLAIAWKQKGDVRDCHSHRSLLVSSHIGKSVHRALRQKYNGLYNAFMQGQQLGGRPKMPVGIPLHISRAFLRWNEHRKLPTSMIFLDLTEAFYRTLRPLAVGGSMSEHCIGLMCKRLGFGSDALHELYELLKEPSAAEDAQVPPHVLRMLQALHHDTWFILGNHEGVVRTEIGSRPGDGFADVVFGYLWAKLLRQLEGKLVAHGILEHIPDIEFPDPYTIHGVQTGQEIPLLGPTWMDDLNVLIVANSNGALISKTQTAMSLLLDACTAYQMQPNLNKGKTEVMLRFCGARSREYRREYYSAQAGLPVVCENAAHTISVVSRYLHLGGIIHHRQINRPEIRRRFAIAHQAFRQHRRLLYRNSAIAWKTRCDMFQSLILRKLTYGMESWTFPTQACRSQIHSGIMRLYRCLLGAGPHLHLSDMEVLVLTNQPDPTELLRCARLRYFGTLHNCRRQAHWGILQEDTDWVALIRDDLHWMWCQLERSSPLQDPQFHYLQWQDLMIYHGHYWKRLIRRAVAHSCLQRKKEFVALDFHARIGRLLLDEGWVESLPDHSTHATRLQEQTTFGCMQCQKKFASFAGESVHMFRAHHHLAPERFLFDGTQCPCCLKEFHTHSKVLAHLRHSTRCKEILQGRRMHCNPVPGVGSCADRELHDIADGALPYQQAKGPMLPDQRRQQRDPHDIRFLEELYLFLLDLPLSNDLNESIMRFISAYPISWTKCRCTISYMITQFDADDRDLFSFPLDDILRCLQQCQDSDTWVFLRDCQTAPCVTAPATLHDWETWYGKLAVSPPQTWQRIQPMPQSLTRYKILLHAFAGRRIPGDIEWFLDRLAANQEGYVLMTVSIDIVIDSKYGDIADPATRAFWIHYICLGFVAGFIAGPPCNTWSKVRAVALPDGKGPRVVRTPEEPWGRMSMRLGELEQVTLGTILLGFSFECVAAMAMHSGAGLIEHPRDPEEDDTVSIWRLPILQALLQMPEMRLVHLAQGLFGAASAKPTTLLALRLPHLERDLHAGMVTSIMPQGASTGKDESGHFRTAPLKEYPPSLCKALAKSFHTAMCTGIDDISMEYDVLPPEFLARCTQMHGRAAGDFIGHD